MGVAQLGADRFKAVEHGTRAAAVQMGAGRIASQKRFEVGRGTLLIIKMATQGHVGVVRH